MKKILSALTFLALISYLCVSCKKENKSVIEDVKVFQANGDIQDDVAAFKNLLGPLNTTPGATTGRREINWDGVPEDTPLANNFFNPTGNNANASLQRGLNYSSTSGNFMVSSNGFATVNSGASSQFNAFSGNKTFANTSTNKWDITFQKAGATSSASVQSFGVVSSDVDKDNSTSLEFFNGSKSIGKYFMPAHDTTSSLSFLGVYFNNGERITDVVVNHDGFLSEGTNDVSNGGTRDLIVLDDFIYSEPVVR